MKPNMLVWLAVFMGLALALSTTTIRGWVAGAVVAAVLVLEPFDFGQTERRHSLEY